MGTPFPHGGTRIGMVAWLAVIASGFPVHCLEPVLQKHLVCQFRQAYLPLSFQTEVRREAKNRIRVREQAGGSAS